MVEPSKRTRSTKKKQVRTPGGRTVTHFGVGKSKQVKCGMCEKKLAGVATGTATEMKNMSKSKKVPAKPYAGTLCPACLDSLMRYVTRWEVKSSGDEFASLELSRDLKIEKFLPRGWFEKISSGKKTVKKAKTKPKTKAKSKK